MIPKDEVTVPPLIDSEEDVKESMIVGEDQQQQSYRTHSKRNYLKN